jgi:hypothetical protein
MNLPPKFRDRSLNLIAAIVIVWSCCFALYAQGSKPVPSPTQAKSESRERSTGSISGMVSDDSGHPILNANVMVSPMGTLNAVSKTESTDENGKFSVRDLVVGAYRISIQAPAYVQTEEETHGPDGMPKFYRTGEDVNFTLEKGGVLTGTVTDPSGVPVVGIGVTAIRIRQPDETSFQNDSLAGVSRMTDDRGIYRIYGLRAGRYLVFAGSGRSFSPRPGPFDRDSPTYYPNSTRDTASVVVVQTGQEAPGIDIRYRGDRGFTISGTLTGVIEKFALLSLTLPGNSTPIGTAFSREEDGRNAFAFPNVPNGDYKIIAFSSDDKSGRASSGTMNISIKNGDVEGVVVALRPLSSITGHLVLTAPFEPKCGNGTTPGVEQTVVSAQSEKNLPENMFANRMSNAGADMGGMFIIRSLSAGNYRLRISLPTTDWYIRSIDRQPISKTVNPAEWVTLSGGENFSGLSIALANGAGSVEGHVAGYRSADQASFRHIYLVPNEKDRSDDTLRFSEMPVAADGTFSFRNLAPGHYFLLSRIVKETDNIRPIYWDAKARSSLVAEAAASGLAVEVKPCQSIKELELKLGPNGIIK